MKSLTVRRYALCGGLLLCDENGTVIPGQMRTTVETEIDDVVKMVVTFALPPDAFDKLGDPLD